jgi:hypothetical protein
MNRRKFVTILGVSYRFYMTVSLPPVNPWRLTNLEVPE